MKQIICLVLTFIISISAFPKTTVSAYSELTLEESFSLQPRYTYTNSCTSNISISNSNATCTSKVTGKSTATKIEATQYLEKKVLLWWENVEQWDKTTNSDTLYISNTKSNLSSGTYRLRTVFKVYSGTSYETVEKTSSEVTV